jgi:DNA-directed RNA polymerase beta' subunit
MNAHIPQSYEAAIELEEIAAVPRQIISPRHAKPVIGIVQDTLVGSYLLTQSRIKFNKREFMNLMMWNDKFNGQMPAPRAEGNAWSGQQVLSTLLPPVNMEMGNTQYDDDPSEENKVIIREGDLIQGVVDKDIYSKASRGIVHVAYNDYGPNEAVRLIDSLQNTVEHFLILNGFSVGISDLIADETTKDQMDEVIQECKKKIADIILQVHMDLFDNKTGKSNKEEFETRIFAVLNDATKNAGGIGQKSLSKENRMTAMVRSGSKGGPLNIAQMIALVGQQNVEGKRIPYGFDNRTLPHYKKYDDGAEARGFIESSFIKGLTPQEFYFHAMSGREGLIDTAVKTADSGYTQRQLVKAMEDLVTHHDGSVRDANMNIVQFHYGEDGINATKIENIGIDLHKMSEADIRTEFGAMAPPEYIDQLLEDRKMLIEKMGRGAVPKDIFSSVNITRILQNIRIRFRLQKGAETDLTADYVLEGLKKIVAKTQKYHKLWAAFMRFHCAPHKLIGAGFTKAAFDAFAEMVIVQNWKSWAQPGEQVGILAAQSIGEPTTQLTLNSVDYDTEIIIAKNGRIWTPQIGEFIDNYYNQCDDESKIQYLENDQVYIELDDGNDWKALSCDEDGKMMWTKLEAITRHPVINEDGSDTILEVELESGRTVKATKAESFLTLCCGKILPITGAELEVGDVLPINNNFALEQLGLIHALNLREILPPTEWLYGSDVQKALQIMKEENEKGNRKWFTANNGIKFTVPYSRSDGFRDAFVNGRNTNEIKEGCVYPKRTRPDISHIPESIPLDSEFGFFVGAYLAEGMSNATQINITNNDADYLAKASSLMDKWNVGHHTVCEERFCETTGIKGTTTSLVIHSTLLAEVMKRMFGRVSYEKNIPAWAFQAPDDFVKGLVDGYISGDGCVSDKSFMITATSCSEKLLTSFRSLLTRYGIFAKISSSMPEQKKFKSVSMHYRLSIRVDYCMIFAKTFTLTSKHKQERMNMHFAKAPKGVPISKMNDVIMDKIVSIKEIQPMTKWVYDVTVEKTRNFTTLNNIIGRDTFHLAGVASKSNVTRGVPRLKELLKVTRNPKATSLNVYLKKEFRDSKEKARQVVQDLELTLLRDITKSFAIYYDPKEASIIKEDRELLEIFKMFEMSELASSAASPSNISKWLIRLEFDRNKMFDKNITINDVVYVLQTSYPEIQMTYSDYNSQKLVLRIRIPSEMGNSLEDIKAMENKILNGVILRGIPGIKAAMFNENDKLMELVDGKYEKVKQYVVDTDGSNFVEVMNHPAVDGTKLYSTHVHDIYNILGIEATRVVLYNEIYSLFAEAGINYRHLGLLCDVMTHAGNLMSIDRYGINKMNIGPLAKASFEETGRILLKASLFGEMDPVTGVSANIMTGQTIRSGTSFTQIMLDEAALARVTKGLPPAQTVDEEEIDLSEIDKLLVGEVDDPCARTEFQMNMAMPPEIIYEEEPDVDMVIVDA